MEAIILAGGKGTRLESVISNVPKSMAPINGRPFMEYLLKWLQNNGVSNVILSIGHKGKVIRDYLGDKYNSMKLEYCEEDTPLGTGGAILKALKHCRDTEAVIVNGDTFFDIDLLLLKAAHKARNADITLALKDGCDCGRYGFVKTLNNRVVSFCEKSSTETGPINGGVYFMCTTLLDRFELPGAFSFESEFLTPYLKYIKAYALQFDSNFVDIGIPEDYYAAQLIIPQWIRL